MRAASPALLPHATMFDSSLGTGKAGSGPMAMDQPLGLGSYRHAAGPRVRGGAVEGLARPLSPPPLRGWDASSALPAGPLPVLAGLAGGRTLLGGQAACCLVKPSSGGRPPPPPASSAL